MKDRLISTGWNWQYGWTRAPVHDTEGVYAYEGPNGQIITSSVPRHKDYMFMAKWEDAETGEVYVTDDPSPRVYSGKLRRRRNFSL